MGISFFGRYGVCLPFMLSPTRSAGWHYRAAIFVAFNSSSLFFTLVGYIAIYITIRNVKNAVAKKGKRSTTSNAEVALARKLLLVVLLDFLCWAPIVALGIASLGGIKVPAEVSSWLAVFVLPLNAAANPLLYTLLSVGCNACCRWREPTKFATATITRRTGPTHSYAELLNFYNVHKDKSDAKRDILLKYNSAHLCKMMLRSRRWYIPLAN